MRYMILILGLLCVAAGPRDPSGDMVSKVTPMSPFGFETSGACLSEPTGVVCCFDVKGMRCGWPPTDAAPDGTYLYSYSAGPLSTGGSQTGGDLTVAGGLGIRTAAMTAANCAAPDTITATIDAADTVATLGTTFACAGTDAACATEVATWLDGLTGIGACAGTACATTPGDFTGVAGTVYAWRETAATYTLATDDATCATIVNGTDGVVAVAGSMTVGVDLDVTGVTTSSGGKRVDSDAEGIELGAADDCKLYYDGTDLQITCASGDFVFNLPLRVGPTKFPTDGGELGCMWNMPNTAGMGDGDRMSYGMCFSENPSLRPFAEADGSGSVDILGTEYLGFSGSKRTCQWTPGEVLTFAGNPGDASKTTTGLIPDGATDFVVVAYTTVVGTNCTSADYGDGSDVDLYGNDLTLSVGTKVNPTGYTGALARNVFAASEVTITGVGGNCFDLAVRVIAYYCTYTSPTE